MGAMLSLLPPHENQGIAAFTSENLIFFLESKMTLMFLDCIVSF